MIRSCSYPGCDRETVAKGYCDTHYRRRDKIQRHLAQFNSNPANRNNIGKFECVYIMVLEEVPYVKIGRTAQPHKRREAIQVSNPFRTTFGRGYWGNKAVVRALEYEVHAVLKDLDCHVRGEWFALTLEESMAVVTKCALLANLDLISTTEYGRTLERMVPDGDSRGAVLALGDIALLIREERKCLAEICGAGQNRGAGAL